MNKTIGYIITLLCMIILSHHLFAQQTEEKLNKKWSVLIEAGVTKSNTNSTSLVNFSPTYTIGTVWRPHQKKFNHGIDIKLRFFFERFKNLPYYYLDNSQQLITSSFNQTNTFPMLYAGWSPQYYLKEDRFLLQGGLGFNFMFFSRYKRQLENGTGTLTLPYPPKNFFVNRPEVSIGVGLQQKIGKLTLLMTPKYQHNFTIGTGNLIPDFQSLTLETVLKF